MVDVSVAVSVLSKVAAVGTAMADATQLMHLMVAAIPVDSMYVDRYLWSGARGTAWWDHIVM